jgi:hypothetical protein
VESIYFKGRGKGGKAMCKVVRSRPLTPLLTTPPLPHTHHIPPNISTLTSLVSTLNR